MTNPTESNDASASNTTDTGFGRFDAYVVKPGNGKKGKDWRGDDTGQMGNELFEKNPGMFASPAAAQRAIINANNSLARLPASQRPKGWRLITNEKGGVDCSGKNIEKDWRIQVGQIVYYPEVPNEITNPRQYNRHCPEAAELQEPSGGSSSKARNASNGADSARRDAPSESNAAASADC